MHSTRNRGAGVRAPVRKQQDNRDHAGYKGLGASAKIRLGFAPDVVVFRARRPRHTHRGLGGKFVKAPILDPKWMEWVRGQMLNSLGVSATFYNSMIATPHAVVDHLNMERDKWRVYHVSQLRAAAERVSLPGVETISIGSH